MVLNGSQQKTLYLGFMRLGTQQQRVPVLFLRDLMFPGGFNPVSPSFTFRDTTLQSRAWTTADRCISSEERDQKRMLIFTIPTSSGARLGYENLNNCGKAPNTMDSSESIRRFGLRR
ncbi:unnamed protein product [Schistosoma margrebowiei]|uniref:Uncharacterized protein n=1 Tax=Schistosoma margrebowiei TaxID=48269 RepID=A0A183NBI2_9TREM|nr:unnamed protein product [Schistosoma margrebowiei]